MEKRALLAVTLSLAVLYVWSALFPPPKPKPRIAPASAASPSVSENTVFPTTKADSVPAVPTTEALYTIDQAGTKFIFSNIGGTLRQVEFPEQPNRFPITRLILVEKYDTLPFVVEATSPSYVKYSLMTPEAKITKEYRLDNGLISANVYVQSTMSRMDKNNIIIIDTNTSNLSSSVLNSTEKSLFEYAVFGADGVHRKGSAAYFLPKENRQARGIVDLISYRDHYNCVIVHPEFSTLGYDLSFSTKNSGKLSVSAPVGAEKGEVYEFTIYAGQQNIEKLKSYNKGFEKVVSFSNFPLFDGIAKFIYSAFIFAHKIIPNWGLCIIIIGVLIYSAVYPLTMRGMKSMKTMQSLQPEMAELREKYKNNPQKLNKEVMELYKKYKVNPLSGCLTFLLQMPIFVSIYQVLWRFPFFKGAGFLWIKDLSKPDQLFLLPQILPIIGNQINLLPIIMAVIMFFQQKITAGATPVVDETQAAQQKMMLIFFPIFLGFMFYKFASGLVLYFTVFYALSALTQFRMSKLAIR